MLNDKLIRIIPYNLNGIHKSFKKLSYLILIIIIILNNVNTIKAEYRPKWPVPSLQRELFFMSLEDGYFGCQINDSLNVLQIFEISKLCDGKPDCFKGSDELSAELKCSDRNQCHPQEPKCTNGVCLDNLCYCNDGFGGKGCSLPDENECKFRPCDVFAHCTNTLGSFYCSCMPGYDGDGFTCHDVNECEDPNLSSYCVENSECCNLPGHFVCKCKSGFEGNGTSSCTDIDECKLQGSCGKGALCNNKLGSYECLCPEGYTGDPMTECWDIDECKNKPCNNGTCHNLPGSYSCTCLPGYKPNSTPEEGCIDINECENKNSCGKNSICINTDGAYFCQCPPGYTGDPRIGCSDIDECSIVTSCGANAICSNNLGSFTCQCKEGFSGDPYLSAGCLDINECSLANVCAPENSDCINLQGGFECKCKQGTTGDPIRSCVDINECESNPCGLNAMCINLERDGYQCKCPEKFIPRGSPEYGCDKAECETDDNCVGNARCLNSLCYCPPPYIQSDNDCVCPPGYINDVYAGCLNREETKISYAECTDKVPCPAGTICYRGLCSRKDSCSTNKECLNDSTCKLVNENVGKQCVDPCDHIQCGPNSFCSTLDHQPSCHCNTSYSGNPNDLIFGCSPKGPPPFMKYCDSDLDCDQKSVCKPNFAGPKICLDVCDDTRCGPNAFCRSVNKKAECYCAKHFQGNPYDLGKGCSLPASAHLCQTDDDCSAEKSCILTLEGVRNCVDVCKHHQCTEGSKCVVRDHRPLCECLPGLVRVSSPGPNGTIFGTCEAHICENDNECKHDEHCIVNHRGLLDCAPVCAEMICGENAECISIAHVANCVCKKNYEGNAMDLIKGCQPVAYTCENCKAREPRDCVSSPDCGDAQECVAGQCKFLCNKDSECIVGERCLDNFCVPLNTRITINIPTRNQPYYDDREKYVTPSIPSIPDQKIVQPNLEPSTFPNLKTHIDDQSTFRKPIKPSKPTIIEDDNEFNNQLPPKVDIQKQPAKPQQPSFDQSLDGDRNKQKPEFNKPDNVFTKPSIDSQSPFKIDEKIQKPNIKNDLNEPNRPVYEEGRPHKQPSVTEKPSINDSYGNKIPSIDHETDSIYNPPEYKPIKPDISRPKVPQNNVMPEYKHPLQPADKIQPSIDEHQTYPNIKQPTINDRKPLPINEDDEIGQDFPMIVDDKKQRRPNMTISDLSHQFPEIDRQQPPRPDLLHPHLNKPSKTEQPSTINNIPPFKTQKEPHQEIVKPIISSKPDVTRPDYNRPDINIRQPDQRQQPTRPDYVRPDVNQPDIADVRHPDQRHPDQRQPDQRQPDHRQPSRPDYGRPDVNQPDTADVRHPDQRHPDQRQPDQRHPDQRQPDQRQPDQRQPDQRQPDQRQPDQRQPSRPDYGRPDVNQPDTGDVRHPDQRHPDQRQPSRPDYGRPDVNQPDSDDIRQPDQRQPDQRQPDQRQPDHRQPSRPDYGRPDISSPDVSLPDQKATRVTTESPNKIRPTKPTEYFPPEGGKEPIDNGDYIPSEHPSKPLNEFDYDNKLKDINKVKPPQTITDDSKYIDNSKPHIKTDIPSKYQPPTRPELKWPTGQDQKQHIPTKVTTIGSDYKQQPTSPSVKQPLEPVYTDSESRQPSTTPESTRIDKNKPSKTDMKTQIKTDQQPKYPAVSSRPDITKPNTYLPPIQPGSLDDFTSKQHTVQPTSSLKPDWNNKVQDTKDKYHTTEDLTTSKPTSKQTTKPSTISSKKYTRPTQFMDTVTSRPTTFTSKPLEKQTSKPIIDKSQTKPAVSNTFTEVRHPPTSTDTRSPSKQQEDKNKLQKPSIDHNKPELREPDDEEDNNRFTSSSYPPIGVSKQPSSGTRKPITGQKQTNVKTDNNRQQIQQPTLDDTKIDNNRIPTFNDYTTTKPEIRKTTQMDQTRVTVVKHSSMQDFTGKPNVKTQHTSSISIPTSPPYLKPHHPDVNTPSSQDNQPSVMIGGERCVNNFCVPSFEEGVAVRNKTDGIAGGKLPSSTGSQTPFKQTPIATIITTTTTEESIHKSSSGRPIHTDQPLNPPTSVVKQPSIDQHGNLDPNMQDSQMPDRTINIRICVDGVCHDKLKGCSDDNDCPSDRTCDSQNRQCISPCFQCGPNSECSATGHKAVCECPKGTIGDGFDKEVGCFVPPETTDPSTERTIPPLTNIQVQCQSDGIQTGVKLGGYDGIIYVKGYSQEYECRRSVRNDERETIDFKVHFGQCGLFHANGEASFILIVQKHPKLVTYRARAYHIKCMYNTGERVISLGFNVSMISTSGTIANTGPPPTCSLSICTLDGNEVSSAEIGDDLLLKVNVQPDYIYSGFARSCIAKTMEEEGEYEYKVTDDDGCATDPTIFGNWEYDESKKSLVARFNAFKFPSSNNLRFQCNIRICFNNCPPANCGDTQAYGRRRRKRSEMDDLENDQSLTLTNSLGLDTFKEGQLREEIQVQSNAILTFDKHEQPLEPFGQQRSEELDHVCLPKLSLVLSMIITTLLSIVCIAVAISCWLMAYRRKANHLTHPLAHPSQIPNPLFSTPEPIGSTLPVEPIPDYYH